MIVGFKELFNLNEADKSVTPKRDIRLGALKMPAGNALNLYDERLGFPLINWADKKFEVSLDGDLLTIKRIIIEDNPSDESKA